MNISKFTQNSIQAVQNCEKIAYDYGNQEIDEEHLLYSLWGLEDSLIRKLLVKMGVDENSFEASLEAALNRRPKVSGGGNQYISNALNQVLLHGEDVAKSMGDQYVSVEHLFLAMLEKPNRAVGDIFRQYQIQKEGFLQALSTVRGNQQVTTDNPEATYDTLNKYGEDLVEKARNQKPFRR